MAGRRIAITPDLVLHAYRLGVFPMAEARSDRELYWLDPDQRGILPLDRFHLPRRLLRTIRARPFSISADTDFPAVIAACADARPGHPETWINPQIESLYVALHRQGHAHSIECRVDGALVGGLYGVSLGGAFFGESMFSRIRDASKMALAALVALLRRGGYRLLDTQFLTDHLAQFGAISVPREAYRDLLARALGEPARWIASWNDDDLVRDIELLRAGSRQSPSGEEP